MHINGSVTMVSRVFRYLITGIFLLVPVLSSGQSSSIRGNVTDQEGNPVDFATVVIQPSGQYAVTDAQGNFSIAKVPAGKTRIQISFYGMETIDTTVVMSALKSAEFFFRMTETSFSLENVTVVAKRNDSGHSTASEISRQAMDHMQTTSWRCSPACR